MNSNEQDIHLSELMGTIIDSWRLIVGFTFLLLLAGLVYIVLVMPVYQADVLLQIEEQSKSIEDTGALTELSEPFQRDPALSTELELLRSRKVIGAVVDNLKLDIIARPKYLPLIGAFLDRKDEKKIKVVNFTVPVAYQGQTFELNLLQIDRYQLFDPEGMLLVKGEVGKPVKISLADGEIVTLLVSELKGESGSNFELVRNARLTSINDLKEALKINELTEGSGILRISLEGVDREKITRILNEIANIYLRQSTERKSAEFQKTLSFIEIQLPVLKRKMETAEAALNNYRLKKGSVDLTRETGVTLDKIVAIDARLTELRRQREELSRQYTPRHPRMFDIDAQIADLEKELAQVNSKVKSLPGTQQEILRLTREAEVSSSLYTDLLNTALELNVAKAGAVSNVQIIDYAVIPEKPIKPNKGLVVALTLILGLLLGTATAFVRKSLYGTIKDPDLIESKLGLPIYATVPYSQRQKKLDKGGKTSEGEDAILAAKHAGDIAIESLRSLRTSLHFTKLNAKNNLLSITSPGPGAGKSFVSMNLAIVLAGADKRVLIIDADLRKGRVHQYLKKEKVVGLSDIIATDINFGKAIHKTVINNLWIVPAGTIRPNPSELLMDDKFEMALNVFSGNFDYVIIDSPPVLAVTDAAIIGRMAGATLLVIKEGQSTMHEIELTVKRLQQAGVNLCGAVFNSMKVTSSRYGYGKYYGYAYSYTAKK